MRKSLLFSLILCLVSCSSVQVSSTVNSDSAFSSEKDSSNNSSSFISSADDSSSLVDSSLISSDYSSNTSTMSGASSTSSSYEDERNERIFNFELLEDNTYQVSIRPNAVKLEEIIVPESYKGIMVTAIKDEGFMNCNHFKKLSIPNTITKIGARAFAATPIDALTIPDSVMSIGESCFSNCGILDLTIGAGITTISPYAFRGLKVKECVIPDNVIIIEQSAFDFCQKLERVYLGSGVQSIDHESFCNNCIAMLEFIVSKDNLSYESIDGVLFEKQTGRLFKYPQKRVVDVYYLPEQTKIIGADSLSGLTFLESIVCNDGLRIIEDRALAHSDLKTVVLNNGLISIGKQGFEGNYSLEEMTLPNSVTSIGESAFRSCGFKRFQLSSTLKIIPKKALFGCLSIEEMVLPKSIIEIGADAFRGVKAAFNYEGAKNEWNNVFLEQGWTDSDATIHCTDGDVLMQYFPETDIFRYDLLDDDTYQIYASNTSITGDIVIPETYREKPVTAIKNDGFRYCKKMNSLTLSTNLLSIGECGLQSANLGTTFAVPDNVVFLGQLAFNGATMDEIVFGSGVTDIPMNCFESCSTLKKVTLNDCLLNIGPKAFFSCSSLEDITIPDSVSSIGSYAFWCCSSLASIHLPTNLKCIESGLFASNQALEQLIVPNSVNLIKSNAFNNSVSLIIYNGTKEAWGCIELENQWTNHDMTIRCLDGDLEIAYLA